jgi:alpha-beta hydrolase superfamily lysophospholipase
LDCIDPIRQPRTSLGHFASALKLLRDFPNDAQNISYPLLILQGTGDSILDPLGVINFLNRYHGGQKELHLYKNAEHSLFNDMNAQQIYSDIQNWLKKF